MYKVRKYGGEWAVENRYTHEIMYVGSEVDCVNWVSFHRVETVTQDA